MNEKASIESTKRLYDEVNHNENQCSYKYNIHWTEQSQTYI